MYYLRVNNGTEESRDPENAVYDSVVYEPGRDPEHIHYYEAFNYHLYDSEDKNIQDSRDKPLTSD